MPTKVLIVDDSKLMRNVIKKALPPPQFLIAGEATNGQEAVDLFLQLRPDIVTMDFNMPVMDGVQAIQKIVAQSPGARIIMISSINQKFLEDDAKQKGAKASIAKPFKPEELIYLINQVMGMAA